jgi:hypothetical protein
MTNKLRQIHNIYCYKCSTCFGPTLPIIRSSELYVQPYGVISCEVLSSVGYIPGMVFRWWYRLYHLTTYNTVRLHIQFRAPDDGQCWPETRRAFLAINIVNLSHLVGHIYRLYI